MLPFRDTFQIEKISITEDQAISERYRPICRGVLGLTVGSEEPADQPPAIIS